jgi:hypothetical protein
LRHHVKLDALVTRNIADLEAAILHVTHGTDMRLFKLMLSILQQSIDAAQWHVQLDDEDELWAAPRTWLVAGTKPVQARGWFEFFELYEDDSSEAQTWLGALTGATGVPKAALYFDQDQLGKQDWKKLVRANPERRETLDEIGFRYSNSDGDFYFPITVDADELAKGFEDGSPEQALEPWRLAIAAMVRAAPVFETLAAGVAGEEVVRPAPAKKRDAPKKSSGSPSSAPARPRRTRR